MQKIYTILNSCIEYLLVTIFGLLVIDVVWQVVSRYVIGQSSSFTEEFARFSLIWLTVLGAAYINGQKEGHLSMDFLLSKLSGEKRKRRQKVIQICMAIFALVIMVIGGGNLVYTTLSLGQTSSALHVPLGYVYAIVPVCGIIIIFFSIYNIKKQNFL
ncbi:TRAP-type C4-dicarboxylate transport system, small permease component [Maribacter sedimenticola]|uniref:TRAP-type C4-dicarboxylate transport system, small permease component n=1 Tax=Maribacter sedimenticola TaxID=228956 RepID=A0ABY1SEI5_9FLAO|nr:MULTISPECIES: TRAP transporter small permease [Maribacter]TVZ17112.1 TRAP-type C4-dicarboxylate transport system permease small subunit [Maribacter sp. MAR_2009_72]SNR31496.1 TRAP-type C4-dicarboxylate transport system, small permease component [Maribacter sedimenticola]